MKETSKENKDLVNQELVYRLNRGEISCADLKIKDIQGLVEFFGKELCEKITCLDLIKFPQITDEDIKNIAENFT